MEEAAILELRAVKFGGTPAHRRKCDVAMVLVRWLV
jgi:hypothetical protein